MRLGTSLCATAALAAFGGCAGDSGSSFQLADSAGVAIAVNAAGSVAAAETWTLSPEPVSEIGGGANPAVPLYRVTAVTPLSDGSVAIGSEGPSEVVVVGPAGDVAATIGREGEGPGEFAGVGSVISMPGDSIGVWDPDRRRLSVFGLDGRFGRELDLSELAPASVRAAPDMSTPSGFTHLLPSSQGFFVVLGEAVMAPGAAAGVARPKMPAVRSSSVGDEVARFPPMPGIMVHVGGPAGTMPVPFSPRLYAVAASGDLVVGTADTTEVRVYGPTGELARIIRWPDHDRTVGGAYLAKWREMVDSQPGMRDFVESVPLPERFPAYEGLVATDRGEVLVGQYAGPLGIWPVRRADQGPDMLRPQLKIPARRWLVFDPEGEMLATLETPDSFEPYAVHDDMMWGVYVDDLDVESVRAYELTRSN